ncbi:hypothetical protein CB1_046886001 [Camelus ferus]|nr:hypothetical protein CB1_046886001 [Camelus ferus]
MTVNPDALKILNQISQPVVVVAIVGPYRTGKSYLMNRLLGQNHGECCSGLLRAMCLEAGIMQLPMASGPSMMNPVCLVERQNSQMTVNPDALKILNQISQPVVVVAIVGPYRTGKSYLMNRLLGQNHGFSLGSTVRSETKGIWMWCVPHPSKESHTLVLLDTEGLGDVEKGDSMSDSWTFTLAMLLSSCFVYNSMSTINHQALEQLQYPSRTGSPRSSSLSRCKCH